MHGWALLVCVFALVGMGLWACGDDDKTTSPGDVDANADNGETSADADIGADGDTGLGPDLPAEICTDPGGDFDGDGIPNAVEDINFNCKHDPGEADPRVADTDNDGLPDGLEDINHDGEIEIAKGECDPTVADTDGDGVLDGDDADCGGGGSACTIDLFDEISPSPASQANSNLALPAGFKIAALADAKGAVFRDPTDKAFGFVTRQTSTGNVAADMGVALAAVAQAGFPPALIYGKPFALPDPLWTRLEVMPLPATNGQRGDYNFAISGATDGAAALRDAALGAVAKTAVSSGATSAACTNVRSHWIAMQRPNNNVVISAIFTCDEDYDASQEIRFAFEDIFGGTIIAPGEYGANDFLCESITPEVSGVIDFLWVIDNSISMADEQANVANTADKFMATLSASGVDWRIGVAATEAYTLADATATYTAHDELIDTTTGLRGVGFITPQTADYDQLFKQYVTFDEGCLKILPNQTDPIAPLGSNICGFGMEQGLASGLFVLGAASVDARPEFALRPEALTAVLWVSDEEDGAFKADLITGRPAPVGAEIPALRDEFVANYESFNARTYGIVGDQGVDAGGVCAVLDETLGIGAQYGESYIEVATRRDGAYGVICNDDLQPTIDRIMADLLGVTSSFELRGYPIASSIRVSVDGVVVPRGDTTGGWVYNESYNAIQFFNVDMTANSTISVGYLLWEYIPG